MNEPRNKPALTGISLTEHERTIVERASNDRGLYNFSATLRQIIREWDEMKHNSITQPSSEDVQQ